MTNREIIDLFGYITSCAFLLFVAGFIASLALRDAFHIKSYEHGKRLIQHPLDYALFPFEDFIRGWKEPHIPGKRLMIVWSIALAMQFLAIFWCVLWGLIGQQFYE
jgi:hypothetical protein